VLFYEGAKSSGKTTEETGKKTPQRAKACGKIE
jgi:hypothetical protein